MSQSITRVSPEELFGRLAQTAEVYADSPPVLNPEERQLAIDIAKRITGGKLVGLWADYLAQKPGKRFRFFVEDRAAELRDAAPEPEPQRFECSECGRQVSAALYFSDTQLCIDCERRYCVQDGDAQLQAILANLTEHAAVRETA